MKLNGKFYYCFSFCFLTDMLFYIYILWSEKSEIYYVGFTSDVSKRLIQHNEMSEKSFTSKHRPWLLKAVFACGESRSRAMEIEKFIKKQKRKTFIKQLLEQEEFYGILKPLVRVPPARD